MDGGVKDRLAFMTALGAGVVGFGCIYLYYKTNKIIIKELTHLKHTIEQLRREIEELKLASTSLSSKSLKVRYKEKRSETSTSFYSEEEDDEYYDLTDDDTTQTTQNEISDFLSRTASVRLETGESGLEKQSLDVYSDHTEISDLNSVSTGAYNELDRLIDGNVKDKIDVYNRLSAIKDKKSHDPEFLWRFARATHLRGLIYQNQGNTSLKKRLDFEAYEIAKKALELDSDHPEIHKWFAITIGSLSDYMTPQVKIENGFIFKKHVDKALRLKPEDPFLYHMIGRWCYEISNLSWIEKKLANSLFATLPETSLYEARQHLLKAETLKDNWKENKLYIAKTFIGEGDHQEAMRWINSALLKGPSDDDDIITVQELIQLKKKYGRY